MQAPSKYCILNYASKKAPDDLHSYEFWYCHHYIRIISENNMPFCRGDIAEIVRINNNQDEAHIYINVLGNPDIDPVPEDVFTEQPIPTLLFLRSRIFFNMYSEYVFQSSPNFELLMCYSTTIDDNKSYVVCGLMSGDHGYVKAIEKSSKVEFEWIISDVPNRRTYE